MPKSLQGRVRTDVVYRALDDRLAVSPIIFSVRQMDRSPELVNMLDVIYEIYDEMGIAHDKHTL